MSSDITHVENQNFLWDVQLLRFTTFTKDQSMPESIPGIWRNVFGNDAAVLNRNPINFTCQEAKGSNNVTLQWQPGRVDWILNYFEPEPRFEPDSSFEPEISGNDNVIEPMETLDVFRTRLDPILEKWFEHAAINNVVRIALGFVFVHPVASLVDGYRNLSHFFPKFDFENATDFFYQINRRRTSKNVEGMQINRLSRWSVQSHQNVRLQIRAGMDGALQLANQVHTGTPSFANRLETDVNSIVIPDVTLSVSSQKKLIAELMDSTSEIADLGDIK